MGVFWEIDKMGLIKKIGIDSKVHDIIILESKSVSNYTLHHIISRMN